MMRDELLEVVYRFYPRGLRVFGLEYDNTEEAQRQRDAARRGLAALPTWSAMLGRLATRYPVMDHQAHGGEPWDPAYVARVEIPGRTLGFHVSLLGPYYGIHRTGLPVEEVPARDLAREIEATYPGYAPIPQELGDEVVPDVTLPLRNFGYATVYDCLLSPEWESSSVPWPPPPYVPPTAAEREARRERLGLSSGARLVAGPVGREPRDEDRGHEPGDDREPVG